MDQDEPLKLPSGYLEAGREYIGAAQKLGLELQFAAWTCVDNSSFRLVLVSDWATRFGSLQLHKLLAQAYFAHALPQEIDPFMVEIFTPKSVLGAALLATPVIQIKNNDPNGNDEDVGVDIRSALGPFSWSPNWRFDFRAHRRSADDIRKFRRFEQNVQRLAA